MRRTLILLSVAAVAVACAKKEEAPAAADTTAAMAPAPAPPAPAVVADADVSGTWTGTSTPMTSDSVVSHWTQKCGAGKCEGTSAEDKGVTVHSTYVLAGDSAVGKSAPFVSKAMKGAKIIDTWTVHFSGTNASGTGAQKLASKPDSVVMAYKFTGSKSQ